MGSNVENIQEQLDNSEEDQILSFILGDEEYGVDILRVQEIKGWERTTNIPNSPNYVKGIINLRGAVVPIVDLRLRFGLQNTTYDDNTVVIILRACNDQGQTEKIIGVVVDGVSDVHTLDTKNLQQAPDMNGVISGEFVKGLATIEESMIIVLNVDYLVSIGILDEIKKSLTTEE